MVYHTYSQIVWGKIYIERDRNRDEETSRETELTEHKK